MQNLSQAFAEIYGSDEIPFACGGTKFATPIASMTDKQVCAVLRYGKRMLNDSYNAVAKAAKDEGKLPPDPQEFFDEWFADLGNKKPGGGGGARLSAYDQAEREVLTMQLQTLCGMTKTAAEKDAKHPADAWKAITRRIVIANVGKGKSSDEIAEKLDSWIEQALPAVKANFEKDIQARMPKTDEMKLDLSKIIG